MTFGAYAIVTVMNTRRTSLAVVVVSLVIAALATAAPRRSCSYVIPDGYIGWVCIEFGVAAAPPTPVEDGRFVFVIPGSGILLTSSELEYGVGPIDEYVQAVEAGRIVLARGTHGEGGLIWGVSNGKRFRGVMADGDVPESRTLESTHKVFYVGSEEQFANFGDLHRNEHMRPLPGPLDPVTGALRNVTLPSPAPN